jgi:di-heme cytochrome c peroxidase
MRCGRPGRNCGYHLRPTWFQYRTQWVCRPPRDQGRPLRRRLPIALLVAIAPAALSFGLQGLGQPARSQTPTAPDSAARPATPTPRPIPQAGPLAEPKKSDQVGLPAELTRQAIPSDNPQTPDKIALGEKLFFDGRLSADGTVACSTCHDPARAFTDGKPTSIGIKGGVGQRNAPTILNALFNKTQFWDGRAGTLEQQAALPIVNPLEMGQPSMDAAVAGIAAIEEYQQAFWQVFSRPPNGRDLVRAIASYERTQVSFDSPFDHFIAGDNMTTRQNAAGICSIPRRAAINATACPKRNGTSRPLPTMTFTTSASASFDTMSSPWRVRPSSLSTRAVPRPSITPPSDRTSRPSAAI